MRQRQILGLVAMLALTGCAVRLGGPSPIAQKAVAAFLGAGASADEVAQLITQRAADFAIVSAPRDSAWFAAVATRANRISTRPGQLGDRTWAFLSTVKPLGDTTLVLNVSGGGQVRVHDALFQIDKNRRLDVLAAQLDTVATVQKQLETLLTYVATDVGATVSVLLAIEPPTPALGDSVSAIMRALYADMIECANPQGTNGGAADLPIRVFYGPAVRITCESAERIGRGTLYGQFELQ